MRRKTKAEKAKRTVRELCESLLISGVTLELLEMISARRGTLPKGIYRYAERKAKKLYPRMDPEKALLRVLKTQMPYMAVLSERELWAKLKYEFQVLLSNEPGATYLAFDPLPGSETEDDFPVAHMLGGGRIVDEALSPQG